MGSAVAVTEQSFEGEVLKSTVPVLVDFWAAWCGPCRAIAPTVEELATEYNGRLKVVKLDVDENPEVSARYGVQSIPTLLLFKDGKVLERLIGAYPKAILVSKIQPHV
ncbi:MAG: thioredoxin [Candidatus Eisenbacteria bacterium RBG_16_71_46]